MKLAHQIKSISYLKAHVAEIATGLQKNQEPLVITQNGQATIVIQDIESYEQTQETLALLKILALGNRQIEEGNVQNSTMVIKKLKEKLDK
jgi:prevent-host-death family protein